MSHTIEIYKEGEQKPQGGVSYITEEECRKAYSGLAFFAPEKPDYSAVMLDDKDRVIIEKRIDEFDAKVLLGDY